jgi:hypothetical protein
MLKPLTTDELAVEADAWLKLLKAKVQEISDAELGVRRNGKIARSRRQPPRRRKPKRRFWNPGPPRRPSFWRRRLKRPKPPPRPRRSAGRLSSRGSAHCATSAPGYSIASK